MKFNTPLNAFLIKCGNRFITLQSPKGTEQPYLPCLTDNVNVAHDFKNRDNATAYLDIIKPYVSDAVVIHVTSMELSYKVCN